MNRHIATFIFVFSILLPLQPASADNFGSGANTFTIDFTTIGSPGNAADVNSLYPAGLQLFGLVNQTF